MREKKSSKIKKNSLFRRIFIPMCLLVSLIACFIVGIASYYDILGELDDNSRNLFDQQVSNRSHDLQTSMVSKWSNLDVEIDRINAITENLVKTNQISLEKLSHSSDDSQLLLKKVSGEVITLLRNHGTTGAYILLSDGQFTASDTQHYPGFYVMDNDPEGSYESGNSDLLLARCPVQLIDNLNIPTDTSWQPSFEFRQEDMNKYKELFQNFHLVLENPDFDIKDVGCWLQPYKLYNSENYRISYVLPLIYNQKIYGMIGIDISFTYLQKTLAYDELSNSGNGGYMLALQTKENTYQSMFLNGPYYSREIDQFSILNVSGENEVYINNSIYCSPHILKLYNSNTPYESQKWVLMGIIDKSELYGFTEHLMSVFYVVIAFIILIGAALSFVLARFIAEPVIDLARRISYSSKAVSHVNIEKTNIIEIDQLIQAIEKMSNDVLDSATRFTNIIRLANTNLAGFEVDFDKDELFLTDGFFDIFMMNHVDTKTMTPKEFKKLFQVFDNCASPTQNANEYIYHIQSQNENIYLRLRYTQNQHKYVGLVEEISDMIKERQVIEHERDHDVLTGLINRRAFQRKMKRLFSIDVQKLKIAALVMMDLDNLKSINDKYGHDCGDAYIKGAANIFKKFSPESTIVSRTSGDEFYLFYYGYDTKEDINEQLKILKQGIAQSILTLSNHKEVKVYLSGGIAWYPSDSTQFEELQRYSDYAMYSVKHSGKGEIAMFNVTDYENNSYIMKKRLDYYQLIDGRMIKYAFQPIIEMHTGNVFGYEALMRSTHPTLRDTQEIISLAKLELQLNKIETLTWQEALRAYAEYYRNGDVSSTQKIFINSISNQILPLFEIENLEKKYSDILGQVVLEVTEDEEHNKNCFEAKKEILTHWNAETALDDYGSGYNSNRNLLIVNPDYVKIDMDLIRDIDKDIDKQKIVENIVAYCHERNKKVIAEGVETYQELTVAFYLNIDYVQGFYFAKAEFVPPVPDENAVKALLELNDMKR